MTSYLFVVDSDEYDASSVTKKGTYPWSCSKRAKPGDRAFVSVTGKGIQYEWKITSPAWPNHKWRYMCKVRRGAKIIPPSSLQTIVAEIPRNIWAAPYTNLRG